MCSSRPRRIAQVEGMNRLGFLVLPVSRCLVGDRVVGSIAVLSKGVAGCVARMSSVVKC